MRFILSGFFMLILHFATSQIRVPVTPYLAVSSGSHSHTGRDRTIQAKSDPDGNLLLLGLTEGDSIFADGTLQKISPTGDLRWTYLMDSGSPNNYDTPVTMGIYDDASTAVLVTGYGPNWLFGLQKSSTYILKVDKDGKLLWRTDLDTLLPPHLATTHVNGYLDPQGYFHLACSIFIDIGMAPSYFLRLDPNGKVVSTFIVEDIEQGLISGNPTAIGQATDSTGNFVYLQYSEQAVPHHWFRRISAITGLDQSFPFNLSALSPAEKEFYPYLDWTNIALDSSGAMLAWSNFPFPETGSFYLARVEWYGKVSYVLKVDSSRAQINLLCPLHNNALISGTYVRNEGGPAAAFLWLLDSEGHRLLDRLEVLPEGAKPCFLEVKDSYIYWGINDISTGEVHLKEIDPADFSVRWDFKLSADTLSEFSGTNLAILSAQQYAIAGTLSRQRPVGSGVNNEEDTFLEIFNPLAQESTGHWVTTGTGTSLTWNVALGQDRSGNYYSRALENEGVNSNTSVYYYRKFNPQLEQLWTLRSLDTPQEEYGLPPFYFNSHSDIYVSEMAENSMHYLKKISPEGTYLEQYPVFNARINKIFIDRKDHIHLSLTKDNGDFTYLILDDHLTPIGDEIPGYTLLSVFQPEGQDDVFAYRMETGSPGGHELKLSLWKNNDQLWEHAFLFAGMPLPFSWYDVNELTGELLVYSIWPDQQGIDEPELHKFSLSGDYRKAPTFQQAGEWAKAVAIMDNGNAIVATDARLDIYDPFLVMIHSTTEDTLPSGGNYIRQHNRLYRANSGTLDCYTAQGDAVYKLAHESFSPGPQALLISDSTHIATANIVGELISNGFAYGWTQSIIRLFDVRDLSTDTHFAEPFGDKSVISVYPNPTDRHVTIRLDVQRPVREIFVLDLNGRILRRQQVVGEVSDVDLAGLSPAVYIIVVHFEDGGQEVKKLVMQ